MNEPKSERETKTFRQLLGIALSSGGALTALSAATWYMANWGDEETRCIYVGAGCASSLLRQYQTVYQASTFLVVTGFVAVGVGVWSLIMGKHAKSFAGSSSG